MEHIAERAPLVPTKWPEDIVSGNAETTLWLGARTHGPQKTILPILGWTMPCLLNEVAAGGGSRGVGAGRLA